MPLPSFLIVGAQKAGTTTLHHHLSSHPNLFLSARKELHFFDVLTDPGPSELGAYARHFEGAGPDQLCGEATPIYMFYPGCLARIRRLLGPVKIIISLRHPVHRAFSHYWHEYKLAWEDQPFERALTRKSRGPADDRYLRHYTYVARSCYSAQIAEAEAVFGAAAVHVVRFEDLTRDPLTVVNGVIDFLLPGTAPLASVSEEALNQAKIPRSLLLHRLRTQLKLVVGRDVIPRRLAELNMRTARYPKISASQYDLCRAMLLDRDPGLVHLFPDL